MQQESEAPSPSLYDLVEYPGRPYAATHPDRLATLGRLYGVATADPRSCRMLEIGCSDGGNLAAIAVGLPESRFLGIDAALSSIQEGRELVARAALQNLELRHGDVLELGEELGQFDFIVAHGVYSWVPERVRQKLLELCRVCLAPNGVAFVSYNAEPGGYLRRPARELMRFAVQGIDAPAAAIQAALEALSQAANAVPQGSPYRLVLEHELQLLARAGTSFVFHDALAPENTAFYFEDFSARAAAVGLRYLTEARFFESGEGAARSGLFELVPETLRADRLRSEQWLDFLKGRTFRQTLLVRADTELDCSIEPGRLAKLFVSAQVEAAPASEGIGDSPVERFVVPGGNRISTDSAVAKWVLGALGRAWPRELSIADLRRDCAAAGVTSTELELELSRVLLGLYAGDVVDLRTAPCRFVDAAGQQPYASPVARAQAQNQDEVTNLRHARVKLDTRLQALLLLLDGQRERSQLAAELDWPSARVDAGLAELARLGLLLA